MSRNDQNELFQRISNEGFKVSFDPPGDGRCFYAATAFQLGLSCETVHNMVFEYLSSHRFTVTFYLIYFSVWYLELCWNWDSLHVLKHVVRINFDNMNILFKYCILYSSVNKILNSVLCNFYANIDRRIRSIRLFVRDRFWRPTNTKIMGNGTPPVKKKICERHGYPSLGWDASAWHIYHNCTWGESFKMFFFA